MVLNGIIVDNEKVDGISLPNVVEGEFSGLFLHPSVIQDMHKHSRSA